MVVVPEHAMDQNFDKVKDRVKLIPIQGVLHNKSLDNILEQNVEDIATNTNAIVMLAGDVQDAKGDWQRYDATMLNSFLTNLSDGKKILFFNGPRTGKHILVNDKLVLDEGAHRDEMDYITKYVSVRSKGKNWQVKDFRYGEPSEWDAALKFVIMHPRVKLILPGESTSMISEALALGIKPVIYTHSAMTEMSKKYVDSLIASNKAYKYPYEGIIEVQISVPHQQKVVVAELEKVIKSKRGRKKKKDNS